jgi:hypothetical protein
VLLISLAVASVADSVSADQSVWMQTTPSNSPSARLDASLIYDPGNNRLVLFGGRNANYTAFGDLWTYSLETHQWSQLAAQGTPPSARWGHSAIYDPGRAGVSPRMLLYGGGYTSAATVYALSLTGTPTWSVLNITGPNPGGRTDHAAVYDSDRDQMVIYGGSMNGAYTNAWLLSLTTLQWTELAGSGWSGFGWDPVAVYDAQNQRMLVFDGFDYAVPVGGNGKTWDNSIRALELNHTTPVWTTHGQYDPLWYLPFDMWGRGERTAAYDATHHRVLFFGGVDVFEAGCADVWAVDVTTMTWTHFQPGGTTPLGRGYHAAAFVPALDQLVVFGGGNNLIGGALYNDTWHFLPEDAIPPAPVTDLAVSTGKTTAIVSWTAPGDDGTTGTATEYDLRRSTAEITPTNFASATRITTSAPGPAGTPQCKTLSGLSSCTTYYVALKTKDDAGNWSGLSNLPSGKTRCTGSLQIMCENELRSRPVPGEMETPDAMALGAVRPNPGRDLVRIGYSVPASADGKEFDIAVFDVLGRRVQTLDHGSAKPGGFDVSWDLRNRTGGTVQHGVYFVRFQLGSEQMVRTVTVLQ